MDEVVGYVVWMNFVVYGGFVYVVCDELSDLGVEIEDEDFVVLYCGFFRLVV